MIEARGLHFGYGSAPVVRGVDLRAVPGRVLGLIGPNGSGKTTLLRLLHGSLRPQAGSVAVDGVDVSRAPARTVARLVAVVVQEHGGDVPLQVADVVLLGRVPHSSTFAGHDDEDRRTAASALERVGALHLATRTFAGLSGGEKQRVLIARALAQQTPHVLLDEPTNHLDVRYQHEVLQLLRGFSATVVVVLHDLNLAAAYCDELVLLDGGTVAAHGTPSEVLVPDVLEPVYGIRVRRVDLGEDGFQLAFRPHRDVRDRLPSPS